MPLPQKASRSAANHARNPRPQVNDEHNALGTRCETAYCPTPPLSYLPENEGVQHNPTIHLVFWGSNWESSTWAEAREEILHFVEGLSGSSYQGILTQYFDSTGRISSTVTVAESYVDESVSAPVELEGNAMVRAEANKAVAAYEETHPGWKLSRDDQFVVLPAPGTEYPFTSPTFCAYHGALGAGAYSFVPYMGDDPYSVCASVDSEENAAHATVFGLSHEYAEAATNPHVGPGSSAWTTLDPGHYEIADICEFNSYELPMGVFGSALWDNSLEECALADDEPAFSYLSEEDPEEVREHTATVKGTLFPEGAETEYYAEYGPTAAYGSRTAAGVVAAGEAFDSSEPVTRRLTGLPLEQTVHYRLVASNSLGSFHGSDRTLTTSHWVQDVLPAATEGGTEGLSGVSCVSESECVAVGRGEGEGESPLALAWDGSEWNVMDAAQPSTGEGGGSWLSRVSCPSENWCMAIGTFYGESPEQPFAEYWSGSEWALAEMPAPGGTGEVLDVSCSSSDFCAAVGAYEGQTMAETWDGTEWSVQSSPGLEGYSTNRLSGISCTSATACVAVGSVKTAKHEYAPLVESWNGSVWSLQSAPAGNADEVAAVSCVSASYCMATGIEADQISLWDGTKWSASFEGEVSLQGIWCAAEDSCDSFGDSMFGRHWNGSEWLPENLAPRNGGSTLGMRDISCPPPGSCVAVGEQPVIAERLPSPLWWKEPPEAAWRIEGSSLAELDALHEPYQSSGTLQFETNLLKKEATITCAESGSGTLGFEETINLSECEVELGGEIQSSCEGSSETPISLDGGFEATEESLTVLDFGEECSIGEEFELTAGTAFDFEAGSTAVELATAMSGGEVLFGGNEAQLSLSSTWALGGKYEGQKFAYAGDFESLNTAWRIEGSSLAELEAWEPYQSSGTLQFETNLLKKEATITCAESGSGTLGFEETINLSECEVELGGEIQSSCEGSSETPISLDGGFEATEESLTVLDFGEECSIGEEFELTAGTAFDFEAGSTAVELATAMSGGEVLFGGNEAQLSLSSTWALTGKYEGQKFAYAGDYSQLNPDWRIEGASLEELEAWEPYESAGTFTLESTALKAEVEIDCAESGSGTLGYEETIALSECETILNGSKSAACAPADTTIVLGPEFEGAGELLTTFALGEEEECPVGEDFDLTAGTAFDFEAGSTAVELATAMSGGEVLFGGNKAQLSLSSTWQMTGKYTGSEFGYL